MTKSMLVDVHRHTLEVRLWTATNKLSARARYDQPKAFRLPCLSEEDLGAAELGKRPSKFPDVSHDQQVRNAKGQSVKTKRQSWAIPMELSLASMQSSDDGKMGGVQDRHLP